MFDFNNLLSLNKDLDFHSKKEVDKWFKLISDKTNMTFQPCTELYWPCVSYIFDDSELKLWYNYDVKRFIVAIYLLNSWYCDAYDYYKFSRDYYETGLFSKEYILTHTVQDVINELLKLIKLIKEANIKGRIKEIEKDFID